MTLWQISPLFWWTGDPEQDPWEWREIIPATGEVAYGKFFNDKAGFISRECFPYFANARRDGYDFDAAWDDELVQRRYKAIMDICEDGGMHPGFELKPAAGSPGFMVVWLVWLPFDLVSAQRH